MDKDKMREIKSYFGLEHCLTNGAGIKVHYGDYVILDLSGQGCRFLETNYDNNLNWIDFINIFLSEEGSHLARLDIACDDKPENGSEGVLSFKKMFNCVSNRKFVSKSKHFVYIQGNEEMIIFGSPASDRRLRIYNKALERTSAGKSYTGHWIRAEFQLRNEAALSFYMRAFENRNIGKTYKGMMIDYLRFTTKPNLTNHTERLNTVSWWKEFTGQCDKIKGFYIGGLEYNMQALTDYIHYQCGSSLRTMLEIADGDISPLLTLVEDVPFNKKQKFLIDTKPLIDKMHDVYEARAKVLFHEQAYLEDERQGKDFE